MLVEKYTKKPVTIEAIKFTGDNKSNIEEFVGKVLEQRYSIQNVIIPTLEGEHVATVGDFIIKGVKGEFYPCKPDIFEMTYEKATFQKTWDNAENQKAFGRDFGWAVAQLKEGNMLRRSGWNGKGMFVVKQIPATIGLEIIPKMQSLPQSAKDEMLKREQPIAYTNQMLIVNAEGRADSWVPSSSDVFAEDWEIVIGEEYRKEQPDALPQS